ncbi:hypothetical protein ZIOFF_028153 [Zingiber officinale]|uniref:Uncharacterized protein n=1 Tax=Zingiber officinale TaxID=94328 RepID=A0A8J5GUD4_ZINOF|nr:hypothetical protein ZIOFF_028153 [Zingiber officinale]
MSAKALIGALSTWHFAPRSWSPPTHMLINLIFNDLTSMAYSMLLKKEKAIVVQPECMVVANGLIFSCVFKKDFLQMLTKRLKKNTTTYENYRRIFVMDDKSL